MPREDYRNFSAQKSKNFYLDACSVTSQASVLEK